MVFVLGRVSGDPVDLLLPLEATIEERQAFAEHLGVNEPILQQYWVYLQDAAKGDFGVSIRIGRPVTELVTKPLFNSLRLASVALFFAALIGVPSGVIAARYRGRLPDRLATFVALLGQSLPAFWVGMILILVFAVNLGWFPTSGLGGPSHYVLPGVALGWFVAASITRLLRSSMLEAVDSEYVKLARSKGVSERVVVWKHSLRNALIPVVTFMGFTYGILIAGAITIEVVFTWPGLGRLAYQAVLWRDFPLLQFSVLIFGAIVIGVNLVVDMLYLWLDPRIRV